MNELRSAILDVSKEYNWDPVDVATIFSYETAGTFDPWKKGPVTQWGEHRGLIQWGEPQRQKYGVYQGMPVRDQVYATARYMIDHGVKPGDGLLSLYAAVNAGDARKIHASDENNGGAPGTVLDKVRYQMDGHRAKAARMIHGTDAGLEPLDTGKFVPQHEGGGQPSALNMAFSTEPLNIDPLMAQDFDKDDPGFWQLAGDAIQTQGTIAALNRMTNITIDPNFQLSEEMLKNEFLGQDLDPEFYAPWFDNVRSYEHGLHIREHALKNQEMRARLAQAGLTGTALSFAAEMLDPVALAAEALTLGAATPFIAGINATRAARAARGALAGSIGGLAAGVAQNALDPNMTAGDIAAGAVFGAGLGSVFGALSRNAATLDEAAQVLNIQRRQQGLPEAPHAGIVPSGSTTGAAYSGPDQDFLDNAFSLIRDEEVGKSFLSTIRMDITGRLRASKNPISRMLGEVLAKDAADPGKITATEEMQMYFDGWTRDYFSTYQPQLQRYFDEQGLGRTDILKRREAATRFNEEVAKYIRDRTPGASADYSQAVVTMGNKIRKLQDEIREMAQNPFVREGGQGRAVAGFEEVMSNPHYMMRMYDTAKVRRAKDTYREEGIVSLIEASMEKANPDVPPLVRQKAARAFTKAITRRAYGLDSEVLRRLSGEDMEDVVDILRDYGGLTRQDAESLLSHYRAKKESKAAPRGKRRLFMDETAQVGLKNKHTGQVETVTVQDLLLVNDANFLFGKYARQMAGRIALARVKLHDPKTGEVIQDGITSDHEFQQLINTTLKRAADEDHRISERQAKADVKRLRFLQAYLTGRPVSGMDESEVADWMRVMEKFNYVRIMNQTGFAQVPEIAGVVTQIGLKAAFTHMPAFRRIINMDGETMLKNGFARDMEIFNAYGVDRLTMTDFQRLDDLSGSPFSADRGKVMDKAEAALNTMSRVTSDISGMNLVNMTLQRVASMAAAQRFVDMAAKGKKFTKARLKTMGLDEEMAERIYTQLRDRNNVETVKGFLTGNKIRRMHFDRWTDPEALEAFRGAMFRMTRQAIQTNDIGMMSMWMSHPVGRLLVQFRRFIFGAFTNNLLFNLRLAKGGDMRAMSFFLVSSVLSAASYSAWTHTKALFRDDRDEYLERELSWDNLAKAAFARSGYSSILPMIFDSGPSQALTGGQSFNYRTTGQSSDVLFGAPTTSLVDDLGGALSAITHPLLNGRGTTRQEVLDLVRPLPFSNAIPVVWTLNAMTRGLKDRKPRDDFE